MSAQFDSRVRMGAVVCIIIGLIGWIHFAAGLADGFGFSIDVDLLLLPVGISLLNAGAAWRLVTTVLLACLTLVLLFMTGILALMDPGDFASSLTTNLPFSPALIRAGMVLFQIGYIAAVITIYYAMIEGKLREKGNAVAS